MPPLVLPALAGLVNRALFLDPDVHLLLAPLLGKTIVIDMVSPRLHLAVTFEETGLKLIKPESATAQCTISGSARAMLGLALAARQKQPQASSEITIQGDTLIAQAFSRLMASYTLDWEALLARGVGDYAAYPLSQGLRKLWAWQQQTRATLEQNISEYLHEEARHLPGRDELNDFFDDIDTLKNDGERLSARIDRLNLSEPQ